MEGRVITAKMIAGFREHLFLEERSVATIQKYIRDVKAFMAYAQNSAITKETVIAYKKYLQENYAVRSVNSMLASINSFFSLFGWNDLKVKSLKLQQQVFCPEEKELAKEEYTRLCRAAVRKHNERLNLILQTICGTGIRVSELQYITVEAVKHGETVVNCKTKTRSVFIVKELRQKLLRYAAEQNIKIYLVVQIIALFVFLSIPTLPIWSAVIACAVIAGVSAACMIASDVGRSEIERVSAKVREKTFYIKQLQADVELLAGAETDTATKSSLTQLAEKIRYSDPMSDEQLADIENRITEKNAELKAATDKTKIINELNSLLGERNRKIKILK